jgi:hypothetical protein
MKTTIVTAVLVFGTVGSAFAQTAITIRPRGNDLTIDNSYVGPYGPGLPGVSMFRGRVVSATPDIYDGGVKTPSYQMIENEQLVETTQGQSQLPILDGWHGTVGEGIPF